MKNDIERLLLILRQCKNKNKKGIRLIFSNLKVSQSGLSRKFNIHVIDKKGDLINLTFLISKIMNYTYTNDGRIRVYGCGMDMLFNTCYELNCHIYHVLYPKRKYNHEKAYHGYVDTNYDLI